MVYFLSGLSGLGSCRVIDRIPKFLRGQINIQSLMERIEEMSRFWRIKDRNLYSLYLDRIRSFIFNNCS